MAVNRATGRRMNAHDYMQEVYRLEGEIIERKREIAALMKEARADGYRTDALQYVASNYRRGHHYWQEIAQYKAMADQIFTTQGAVKP